MNEIAATIELEKYEKLKAENQRFRNVLYSLAQIYRISKRSLLAGEHKFDDLWLEVLDLLCQSEGNEPDD